MMVISRPSCSIGVQHHHEIIPCDMVSNNLSQVAPSTESVGARGSTVWRMGCKQPEINMLVEEMHKQVSWGSGHNHKVTSAEVARLAIDLEIWLCHVDPKFNSKLAFVASSCKTQHILMER